jgi:phospholipase/carboxylesterase
MKTTLDSIEINPPQKEIGSVIWLHGLGADGNDFVPIVPNLNLPSDLPLRFVFPHAPQRPVTINNGYVMRAWFDIYSMTTHERIDQKGIEESMTLLQNLIAKEQQRGIPPNKIVLAGFSQGAVIALLTGLKFSTPLAGIIALSGFLPHSEKLMSETNAANYTTPIFVAHGTEDTVVPYTLGLHTSDMLQRNKYLVSWHSYKMPHSVCQEEIGDLANWLRKVFMPAV